MRTPDHSVRLSDVVNSDYFWNSLSISLEQLWYGEIRLCTDEIMNILDYELATPTRRFCSKFLDLIFSFIPLLVAALIYPLSETLSSIIGVFGYGFFYFYTLFSDGFKGGHSYGKKAMGICVINAKSGKQCTFSQSFSRNFWLLVLGVIDWVFIFSENRQRLGDRFANTIVVFETSRFRNL